MAGKIDTDTLRTLVREALREALAAPSGVETAPGGRGFPGEMRAALNAGRPARMRIAIGSAEDLNAFARDIARASEHEDLKAAIVGGAVRFELSGAASPAPAPRPSETPADNPPQRAGAFALDTGILSETRVAEIGRTHSRIVVGHEVVMTPLARDKARELKIELVRQKP